MQLEGTNSISSDVLADGLVEGVELATEEEAAEAFGTPESDGGLSAMGTIDEGSYDKTLKLSADFLEREGLALTSSINAEGFIYLRVHPYVDYSLGLLEGKLTSIYAIGHVDAQVGAEASIKGSADVQIFPDPATASYNECLTPIALFLHVEASGKISLKVTADVQAGLDSKKGVICEGHAAKSTFTAQANGMIGPRVKAGLRAFDTDWVELVADVGAAGSYYHQSRSDNTKCTEAAAWLAAHATYTIHEDVAKLLDIDKSGKWVIWDKDSSPLKYGPVHWDNGEKVESCSHGGITAPEPVDDLGESGDGTDETQISIQIPTFVPVRNALDDYSWPELKAISNKIGACATENAALEVAKAYNLCTQDGKLTDGTKVLKTNNGDLIVHILGFWHDKNKDDAKCGITFGITKTAGYQCFNVRNYDEPEWSSSLLRTCLRTYREQPSGLVEPVEKLTAQKAGEPLVSTFDKFWIPSITELCGSTFERSEYNIQGKQYKRFKDMGLTAEGNLVGIILPGTHDYCTATRSAVLEDADAGYKYYWAVQPFEFSHHAGLARTCQEESVTTYICFAI